MAGGFILSMKALHMLAKITQGIYRLIEKGEKVLGWVNRIIDKFPDPEVVIDKLTRVNGNDKVTKKGAGE